ncbi:hypothetical protein [Clostridium aceticum]|nr:hypothetical protein [Clostridium aceticum]
MIEENKTKSKNMTLIKLLENIKFGTEVKEIGDTMEVSPIHANILVKKGIAKKV